MHDGGMSYAALKRKIVINVKCNFYKDKTTVLLHNDLLQNLHA
jgi:hypothetical protein